MFEVAVRCSILLTPLSSTNVQAESYREYSLACSNHAYVAECRVTHWDPEHLLQGLYGRLPRLKAPCINLQHRKPHTNVLKKPVWSALGHVEGTHHYLVGPNDFVPFCCTQTFNLEARVNSRFTNSLAILHAHFQVPNHSEADQHKRACTARVELMQSYASL